MFEWFGKLRPRPEDSQATPAGTAPVDLPKDQAGGAHAEGGASGPGEPPAESRTSVHCMLEILKLLERIEYGLDEQEIAEALAISPDDVLANCAALEDEMVIHHHEDLANWFIGQRGLEFLRLHGNSE